jgi:hypothetical protein
VLEKPVKGKLTYLGRYLGRYNGVYDSLREILSRIPPQPLMPQLADSARSAPSRGLPDAHRVAGAERCIVQHELLPLSVTR